MLLLAATVRNYRNHRDTSIRLKEPVVLIHGPNESGKSTLVEAIHCALFLKAKGNTSFHKSMLSDHGGTPEVEIEFEEQGTHHRLRKIFGSSGNTVLESEGQATLNGDAAETQLARLLHVAGTVSGGGIETKMEKRWGHLWVWQGKSSQTPLEAIEESQSRLHEKLQAQSGQTLLTSETDNRVIDALKDWETANFTTNGKAKAGSTLDRAEKALHAALESVETKRATLESLDQAAARFLQAEADIGRHGKSIEDAKKQLDTIREKLKTVAELRERLKEKTRLRETTEKSLKDLQAADTEIRELNSTLEKAETKAAPAAQKIAELKKQLQTSQTELNTARVQREAAGKELSRLRAIADAWQAHRDSLRETARIESIDKDLAAYQKLEKQQKELSRKLAPLEAFTDSAIKSLSQVEREAEQAQLRLETYALQVEVIVADQSVQLNDQSLTAGQTHTVSQAAELKIGSGTRIRLSPGGAEDLEAARKADTTAREKLKAALKKLVVRDFGQAQEKLRDRTNLERDGKALAQQIDEANPQQLQSELETANKVLAQRMAERDASAPENAKLNFPDTLSACDQTLEEAREALKQAEGHNQRAETEEKGLSQAVDKCAGELAKEEEAHRRQSDAIKDLTSRLTYALEKAGDNDARSKAINQARAQFDQASTAEREVTTTLEKLGADQLELDDKRLSSSLEADQSKLKEAERSQIEARTELRNSGSQDPERECKEAVAEAERCQHHYDSLLQRAKVRRHLLERLQAARQATTAALTQPLEDAVSPYLKLLFGGSRARLLWSEDGSRLESFALDRTENRQGLYDFTQLSHGTREQVALALRLAMAQLLAADHNGCLPLVLDDAFTHADRERIEKLKSLLFQASKNGLQIILLSCHPENYSGLSAAEVGLNKG